MDTKTQSPTITPQPRLRRQLFGVRPRDVWAALDQREEEAAELRQRASTAAAEAEALREQVSSLEARVAELEGDAGSDADAGKGKRKFCDCPSSEDLLEEMTKVVTVTEEATNRILGEARDTLMKEIEAAEALRDRARAEIQEAAAWRRHWAPIIQAFQATVAEAGAAVQDVPERMRDALAPLTAAAAALDEDLRQFAAFEVTMSMETSVEPTASADGALQAAPDTHEPPEGAGHHDVPIVVSEPATADDEPVVIADEAQPAAAGK